MTMNHTQEMVGLSVRPGERDLVERLRPEPLRGARHHATAEHAVEFGSRLVVRERPDHHALQPALGEVALGGREQTPAEAEALEFRTQVKLVDFAFEMQAAGAIAAVVGIAGDLVAKHQYADAAALADCRIPPLRAAAVDQLFQLAAGDNALISGSPSLVMGGRDRGRIRSLGWSNLDKGSAHGTKLSNSAGGLQGLSLIIG